MISPKAPLLQKCIHYLESLPHLEVELTAEPYDSPSVLADGKLIIGIGKARNEYVCELKPRLSQDWLEIVPEFLLKLQKRLQPGECPLLITEGLSNFVAKELVAKNIEFVDVKGQVYLNRPGLYILVFHQPLRKTGKSADSQSLQITTATLKVMYGLLSHPAGESLDKLASYSGVSLKTLKQSLSKLQKLGYIRFKLDGDLQVCYKIQTSLKLLERWELGYSEQLRSELLVGCFNPINQRAFSDIQPQLLEIAAQYGCRIGGELAAGMLTDYLQPIGGTLHLPQDCNFRRLALDLRVKPSDEGSITFLREFGMSDRDLNADGIEQTTFVNPLLIHAELMYHGNSRLRETAQRLYDKYLRFEVQ